MSEVVKRLRERRANVWEQAKELADRAAEENRQFSGDEEGQWQQLNAELDALDKRIKNVLDGELRAKETEDQFAKLENKPVERGKESRESAGGQESSELRRFLAGDGPRFFDVVPQGPVNFRALTVGTGTAGGDTVPTTFYERLVEHLIETSAIMQAGATMLNTASGETIQVPKTTSHSSAAIVTEGAAIGTSDPTFGQISLGAYKYGTLIQVSRELINDSGVDLEGYLARQTGRALGNAFGAHAITGTGTGQPRGVVTDATVGVTGATGVGGAPSPENLVDLFHSVIAPYRASQACRWIMNDTSVAAVRKIRDSGDTGNFLWQPGLQAGVPDTILGKPVLTDPNVAAIAVGASSIIFGDMSQFFVRLAGGVRFERSDDYAFNTDLTTFRALLRADAALVDLTGAVKLFQGGAS
jgi:HK97 family phage major capsid protein